MPFFPRSAEPEEEAVPTSVEADAKRHGLFGSLRRETSPTPSSETSTTAAAAAAGHRNKHDSGLFRRSADEGASVVSSNGSGSGGSSTRSFLHRSFGRGGHSAQLDPSILQARERVLSAEKAEAEADRALEIARRQVREAREHARRLEREAEEEARRAKIKQFHAREVSRRAKPLGRHGS